MDKRVEIIERKEIFRRFFFLIEEARLRHQLYNGKMSDEITRLKFERGDSVAILMHDRSDDTIILTEQFRFPTYDPTGQRGDGWIVEIPAGSVEADEDPTQAITREVEEESGYVIGNVQHISTFYLSPGGTSERILLYYAQISKKQKLHAGGGIVEEGEDVRVIRVPLEEAARQVENGVLNDAKTIIGIQWMMLKGLVRLSQSAPAS